MTRNEISNNKRIAKNTIMLYIRMLLSMVVSLYTSRVVLNTLGVEDYGIYGVVGGVVAMFSFLNNTMSGATSRFLTFEMGRGDFKRLKNTFSSALIIHLFIVCAILLLAETIGLWFLANKLVIPVERMEAAHWVYQLSILSMAINVTQVPYNASIIAHEKMDVYAYVEILNVTLKLLIVYLLVIGDFDKLILYAVLTLVVSMIIALIYRIYCIRNFEECRFEWNWNKNILKGLLSFSTYNLYGNFGSVMNMQGTNFALNHFWGVMLNSASSIATTVANVVNSFTSNILVAFRPQITKSYAQGDITTFQNLFVWAIKIILLIYAFLAIPIFVEIDTILTLWLKNVPSYTAVFCRCILVNIYFETLRYIITMGIHAVGKVKVISFYTGTILLLNPLLVYIILNNVSSPEYTYYSIIFCNLFLCIFDIHLLKKYIPLLKLKVCCMPIIKSLCISSFTLLTMLYLSIYIHPGLIRVFFTTCISIVCLSLLFYFKCLNMEQKKRVLLFIKSKIQKNG